MIKVYNLRNTVYKYILIAIITTFFIGCSTSNQKKSAHYYTAPAQNFNFLYASGSGKSKLKAKNNAISNLRVKINNTLDKAFLDKTTKLKIAQEQDIKQILKENEIFSKTITMFGLRVEKATIHKKEYTILVRLPKSFVFDYANKIFTKKMKASKQRYEIYKDKISITKYMYLLEELPHYYKLATLLEAKKMAYITYNTKKEAEYLNEIGSEFFRLKQSVSLYIFSDVNSKVFALNIKNAIIASGLTVSSKPLDNNHFNLFISSQTTNSQDYDFNKAKTLIKYRTFDQNKKEIAFRQHTFVSKSRVSHLDAKKQSTFYVKNKIRKLGVYDFIGLY